jgi:hypothetical protein
MLADRHAEGEEQLLALDALLAEAAIVEAAGRLAERGVGEEGLDD